MTCKYVHIINEHRFELRVGLRISSDCIDFSFCSFFHSKTGRISLVKSAKTIAVKMTKKRIEIVIMINTKIKDKNSKNTYHIMRFSRSIGS